MGMRDVRRTYQPIWTPSGEDPSYRYQRPSDGRYRVIRELASRFKRPFSVLDIGSNYAYFDVRLMGEFDCCCVMVDNKFTGPILKANQCLDRSVVIQKHLSAQTLESLSKSEHFDIVLGLAVLHHFDEPRRAYEAMRKLGWWTIFEIPGNDDIGAANPHVHAEIQSCFKESPNGYFPSHVSDSERPYYILENEPYLFEQSLDAADRDAPVYNEYSIKTSFEECVFVKDGEERPFIPGMNLHNFIRLGGTWPLEEDIKRQVEQFSDHPDFHPWNFVLGHGVHPIDMEDKFS